MYKLSCWRKILRPGLRSDFIFAQTRIYVEIVHYVENYPSGTSEFIYFWRQLGSYLGVKISGDSFLGIPLRFCWCLVINSFWHQFGSLLEFSCGNIATNFVWRQLRSPLGFAIPGDSFLGIPPCSPRWGLLWFFVHGELHFPPLGVYYSYPFLGNYINNQITDFLRYPQPSLRLRTYVRHK